MELSEFDRNYVAKEIDLLRKRITDYILMVVQTERLCVGATGAIYAFLLTSMKNVPHSSIVAASAIPIVILILGFLRTYSLASVILDMIEYIEDAEVRILDGDEIGFQRVFKRQKGEYIRRRIYRSAVAFWIIGIAATTAFTVLILLNVIK